MRRFRLPSVLSAIIFVLVAGCVEPAAGTEQSDAAYQPEASRAYSEQHGIPYYGTDPYQYPYHPCVEIPPDVIESLGHDPASGERDTLGRPNEGWRSCMWFSSDPWYSVSLSLTSYTLEDLLNNPEYHGFEEVLIRERLGLRAYNLRDSAAGRCYVAVPASPGMAMVRVGTGSPLGDLPDGGTACGMAIRYIEAFEPFLPAMPGEGANDE
ncbi:DUF3558 domain-containing protein [Hoyosella altamirensis]|uniref:DUF3558 domain-containing protein n=1 Tax=Hoyosella altamirensis TaxID=616997 RepID=UPI0007DAF0FD|nr:DUF3558 domain-containing protein [Hoyosella altamirensis]